MPHWPLMQNFSINSLKIPPSGVILLMVVVAVVMVVVVDIVRLWFFNYRFWE